MVERCLPVSVRKKFASRAFDDQKYLDQFPILEPRTLIYPHPGINVGGWNATSRTRSMDNNQLLVMGEQCLLVHMNHYTLRSAFNGKDPLLQPVVIQYLDALAAYDLCKKKKTLCPPLGLIA